MVKSGLRAIGRNIPLFVMWTLLILSILFLMQMLSGEARGEEIIVDQGEDGDYATLGVALWQASDGDIILIRPGDYDEGYLWLSPDNLTIQGDSRETTHITFTSSSAINIRDQENITISDISMGYGFPTSQYGRNESHFSISITGSRNITIPDGDVPRSSNGNAEM